MQQLNQVQWDGYPGYQSLKKNKRRKKNEILSSFFLRLWYPGYGMAKFFVNQVSARSFDNL